MSETTRCACLDLLIEEGYAQTNLLYPDMVFVYAIVNGKVGKLVMILRYCPICGVKILNEVGK